MNFKILKFITIIVITIGIPPLGIFLSDGFGVHLLTNVIITIIFIVPALLYNYIFFFPGIIHGLVIIFQKISKENIKQSNKNNKKKKNNKSKNKTNKNNTKKDIKNDQNKKKKGRKKKFAIFIEPKKYKRIRKSIKKEKVEVVNKPKINNLWGSVLFLSVVIGSFQISISGIINILKNEGNDDNNDIFDEITIDFYDTTHYTMEIPTETDTMIIFTSLPTNANYNNLEYSKTITEISPTSSILSASTQEGYNKSTTFDDNINKNNNTIKHFTGYNIFNNIIKNDNNNNIFNEIEEEEDFNDSNNINKHDNNNKKEKDKEEEKKKEFIINIVVKVVCYIMALCLTFGYYKILIWYIYIYYKNKDIITLKIII